MKEYTEIPDTIFCGTEYYQFMEEQTEEDREIIEKMLTE
jgi:hypothetical protein